MKEINSRSASRLICGGWLAGLHPLRMEIAMSDIAEIVIHVLDLVNTAFT